MTRLGDLVDLEARILDEQGDSEEVRRSRYRQLGRRLLDQGSLPEDPGAALNALLELDSRPDAPGRRFEAGLRLLHTLLAFLGLLVGGSLALGLIQNTGRHPVNVLTVLAALVGTQLALLALLILALLPRREARSSGPVQNLLRAGLSWILRRVGAADRMTALQDRLDAHRGLLRWLLVRAAQIFGVAFNVGALAGIVYRITTTDISFGWSTTLHLDAAQVQRLTALVATPWSWLTSAFTPGADLIRRTQYSHFIGRYIVSAQEAKPGGDPAAGAWWPFLVLAIAVYGLLPRLIAFAVSSLRVRTILAETPRRDLELARISEWMGAPVVTTRPEGPDPAPYLPPSRSSDPEPALPPSGTAVELLDGAPSGVEPLLRERFGWTVGRGPDGPLVAVVSAWEEPTKGQLRRFTGLRGRLADRLLVVALFDPSPNDDPRRDKIRDRWKRDLPGALGGVRVRVEAL